MSLRTFNARRVVLVAALVVTSCSASPEAESASEVTTEPAPNVAGVETAASLNRVPVPCIRTTEGTVTNLTPAGAGTAGAWDINERGDVVGTYRSPTDRRNGTITGAIWRADGTRDDVTVVDWNDLRGINDAGVVVGRDGTGRGANEGTRSFVLAPGGEPVFFAVPNAISTEVDGVNNHGQAVGLYYEGFMEAAGAFIREPDGTLTTFVPPQKPESQLLINNLGQVAGTYQQDGVTFGFVRHADGQMDSFEIGKFWRTATLRGLSDDGATVGWRDTADATGSDTRSAWIRSLGEPVRSLDGVAGVGIVASAVTASGVIMGDSGLSGDRMEVILPNGDQVQVDSPGGSMHVKAANESLQAVGIYRDGIWAAYRWDPDPCVASN